MKKHSLALNAGLSLSQAQSISNLCYQRTLEIDSKLSTTNNFSKKVSLVDAKGEVVTKEIIPAKPLPSDVTALLLEKAALHACQAFLMVNIKIKDALLKEENSRKADTSSIVAPTFPDYIKDPAPVKLVDEEWGWNQLSASEYNEFLEAEAFSAHIGQFIHKGGKLSNLREELPNIASVEWMEITKDTKTPVDIVVHHKAERLMELHESLAKLHREYEQKTNYFKAKVKNIVTEENSTRSKAYALECAKVQEANTEISIQYDGLLRAYKDAVKALQDKVAAEKHDNIKNLSAMRIKVEPRFQPVIDKFLVLVKES